MKKSLNATTEATTTKATTTKQELALLCMEIIHLSEAIKERETLLADRKKRVAELLPNDEPFRVTDTDGKPIVAKWQDKLTKTIQQALVEQNHGIKLSDADYKQTPSHYVSVTKLKA